MWRWIALMLLISGCGSSESTPSTHPKASPTQPLDPSKLPTKEVDASASAAKIGFPMLEHPSKPPVALMKEISESEHRYDITQTTADPVRDAIQYYEDKLKLKATGAGDGATLMGYAPNGLMVMLTFATKDSETVVGAKVIESKVQN